MEIKKSLGDFQCFGSCKQTVHHFVRLELPKCCRAHMFSHVRFFKYNHYNTACSLGCQSAVGVAVSISCVCVYAYEYGKWYMCVCVYVCMCVVCIENYREEVLQILHISVRFAQISNIFRPVFLWFDAWDFRIAFA